MTYSHCVPRNILRAYTINIGNKSDRPRYAPPLERGQCGRLVAASIDTNATSSSPTLNATTHYAIMYVRKYRVVNAIVLKSLSDVNVCPVVDTYIFVIRVQRVPHGRHDLRYFAETRVGIFAFDRRLCVPEEQRVSGHGPGK